MPKVTGGAGALLLALVALPAMAQTGVELQLAIVAAADRLRALGEEADTPERAEVEEALARLCGQTDYADLATCVDVARNERWLDEPSGRGCVITVGRAWGCSTQALRGLASSTEASP